MRSGRKFESRPPILSLEPRAEPFIIKTRLYLRGLHRRRKNAYWLFSHRYVNTRYYFIIYKMPDEDYADYIVHGGIVHTRRAAKI